METAYKARLVPTMESHRTLEKLNDFENDFLHGIDDHQHFEILPDEEVTVDAVHHGSGFERDPIAIDMPMTKCNDLEPSLSDSIPEFSEENNGIERTMSDHIFHVEPSEMRKELNAHDPDGMEWKSEIKEIKENNPDTRYCMLSPNIVL